MKAVTPAGDTTSDTHTFVLRSLTGGRRELLSLPCPQCRRQPIYRHRTEPGGPTADIGTDPEVIRVALHAILDQPGVDVFTLVVTSERDLTSYVLPRHHLPAFRITDSF